jgi:predicted RNA binding protein YcfA (HicA-like mRNA interferase family)
MPPIPRVSGREIIRGLRSAGWRVERITGSHHVMVNATNDRVVSLPVHGAKTLPIGTIKGIIDKTGLTVDEFIKLF